MLEDFDVHIVNLLSDIGFTKHKIDKPSPAITNYIYTYNDYSFVITKNDDRYIDSCYHSLSEEMDGFVRDIFFVNVAHQRRRESVLESIKEEFISELRYIKLNQLV